MAIKHLKKAIKTPSTDDHETRATVQKILNDLEINKNYHKCSINKNKKYLSPESIKIKNIF